MQSDSVDLAALIASRICHDLISPVGAISNGLELLTLSGATGIGPEFDLISDSCSSATARIRFFRIAFGTSSDSQMLSQNEVRRILQDVSQGTRLRTEWLPVGDQTRREVQLAFLALLCLETALPLGGTVKLDRQGEVWHIEATAPRINVDPDLWQMLTELTTRVEISPSRVQFLMLQTIARELKRKFKVSHTVDSLKLVF
ncbi:histidine phosphotransferase family protein [Puniceibacterium sediminis]|uniref:Histidine phosphotransferase ChpT n=1 Tax=Puniceibacterium sediminis TaxID=1608407 RepID=A0A238XSK0_9RHOB|nr:histidine phosphotransferase family protein [Puniceibacterium sediminis]SNR61491.1 histidine phosphotransferase ChpT [Puniceibacterium sediminis]